MTLYESYLEDLAKYPHLWKAVQHFYQNDGRPEHIGHLPNLIVWIRHFVENEEDVAQRFDMPEEVAEDFYGWGHNSRWANTFWWWTRLHFFGVVVNCLDIAETHGDFDVEQYMQEQLNKEAKNNE